MKAKIALLVGAGAGYVLGTRDGRQRFEQMRTKAEDLWQNPQVQDKVAQVNHAVSHAQHGTQAGETGSAHSGHGARSADTSADHTSSPSTSASTSNTKSSTTGGLDD